MQLFAACQRQGNFDPAALEVHFQRHQGQALLFDFADQLANFLAVHQQFAGAAGVVVEILAGGVMG